MKENENENEKEKEKETYEKVVAWKRSAMKETDDEWTGLEIELSAAADSGSGWIKF